MLTRKTTLLLLRILERVITQDSLHARWLNTLSYLEYIGTRKILKSLPSAILNKAFLEHIQEESRHSLFFKALAEKISGTEKGYKEHELIAGIAAKNYFKQVDHYSVKFSFSNPLVSYLYTTYVVEQRALAVYSFYQDLLKKSKKPFSIQAVLNDEKEHLDFVIQRLKGMDPLWQKNLDEISHFEHQKYFSLLVEVEKDVFELPQQHFQKLPMAKQAPSSLQESSPVVPYC